MRTTGSVGLKTLEAIREAGLKLLFEHGYEAMSLRQLASEVGIQAGSLYNHIRNKQQLLYQLVSEHAAELLKQLDASLADIGSPVDRLNAFVAFHLEYHMTRQREVFVVHSEIRSLEPQNYKRIMRVLREYESRLSDILRTGTTDGSFNVIDVEVATRVILAMLTGVCAWYRPDGRLTKQAIAEIHEALLFRGLLHATPRTAGTHRLQRSGKSRAPHASSDRKALPR
jgi:AcrR family transcriptional regulator